MEKIKEITQKFINVVMKISKKILPKKLIKIEEKLMTVEIVLYILFGIFTTVVNIGLFSIMTSIFKVEENLANSIAIIIAVLFAYFTNKDLVFNSNAQNFKQKLYEFFKFMLGRAFTMILEFVGFYLFFNIIGIPRLISKTAITIIVIIVNYFISKFFAFKK